MTDSSAPVMGEWTSYNGNNQSTALRKICIWNIFVQIKILCKIINFCFYFCNFLLYTKGTLLGLCFIGFVVPVSILCFTIEVCPKS